MRWRDILWAWRLARARAKRRELRHWSSRYAFDDALRPRKPDNTCIIYPDAFYEVDDYDLQRALRVAEIEQRSWQRFEKYIGGIKSPSLS